MPHSHPEREEKREADTLLKGIITGAVIGAGILWLLGTDTGKKLKKDIEEEGKDLFEKITGNENEIVDEDDLEMEPTVPEMPTPLTPQTEVLSAPVTKKTATIKKPTVTGRRFFKRKA